MTHTCIRPDCGVQYDSTDPEPYYCPVHIEEKNKIAATINAKMATRPHKEKVGRFSPQDFIGKNGRIFFNAKDIL